LTEGIHVIIQSRLGSERLPNKVIKNIYKKESITSILIKRLSKSKNIDKIIFAIPNNKSNDILENYLKNFKVSVFRGSENNVFQRYYDTATYFKSKIIIRITGDCLFADSSLIDDHIKFFLNNDFDYITNANPITYPDGLDFEIFNYKSLKKANLIKKNFYQKEHVTPLFKYSKSFKIKNITNQINLSNLKVSIDTENDFKNIKKFIKINPLVLNYNWLLLKKFILQHKELLSVKNDVSTNGNFIWQKAIKIIPGGSMVYSKRQENFAKNSWPTYFTKTKGCKIWGVDGKIYTDLSLMGLGTNTLGYSNKNVDRVVSKIISTGNLSTLNAPEEVYLAEKLISLHNWADMVRFTRSGGEANAVAIRLARAASGLDKIAFCGYHGWHDWYLSGNLSNQSNLDNHLFKNVNPKGVPKNLINTSFPFKYNDINSLEKLINMHKIAAVKMEVSRDEPPNKNFLENVRKITKKNNIILIFDECTSGFRENYGGLHLKYNVTPDMLILGKALGNGYAVNAVLGKKEIMDAYNKTFISSTFWTERIGSGAALATLEEMKRVKSWEIISKIGKKIKKEWSFIGKKNQLNIEVTGLDALCEFKIISKNFEIYKRYITKEFLRHKILAKNKIYVSTSHADINFDRYYNVLDKIFSDIKEIEDGKNIKRLINEAE